MADDRVKEAVDIVARNVIHNLMLHSDLLDELWGDEYPEVGENDWDRVKARVTEIVGPLYAYSEETYRAAYDFLDARADAE